MFYTISTYFHFLLLFAVISVLVYNVNNCSTQHMGSRVSYHKYGEHHLNFNVWTHNILYSSLWCIEDTYVKIISKPTPVFYGYCNDLSSSFLRLNTNVLTLHFPSIASTIFTQVKAKWSCHMSISAVLYHVMHAIIFRSCYWLGKCCAM